MVRLAERDVWNMRVLAHASKTTPQQSCGDSSHGKSFDFFSNLSLKQWKCFGDCPLVVGPLLDGWVCCKTRYCSGGELQQRWNSEAYKEEDAVEANEMLIWTWSKATIPWNQTKSPHRFLHRFFLKYKSLDDGKGNNNPALCANWCDKTKGKWKHAQPFPPAKKITQVSLLQTKKQTLSRVIKNRCISYRKIWFVFGSGNWKFSLTKFVFCVEWPVVWLHVFWT